jgi:Na+-transporting NADH:ubiquinone oxidoreductase subunit C
VPPRNQAAYTVGFSAVICIVCAVLVSSAAVVLRDRQQANVELDRKRNVLMAAGALMEGEDVPREAIEERFGSFRIVAVDLRTGEEDPSFVVEGYDATRALASADSSRPAPPNTAQVVRLPNHALVYKQRDEAGRLDLLVLPIEGKGLWSTLYGFLALDADLRTIRGLTYYQHGETPGLGGEVDNPRWKALWPGREAFDGAGAVAIEVTRGPAGTVAEDPHRVDGLAGATLTSRGVTNMLRFWLGENGFEPYLARLRQEGADVQTP